MPKEQPAKPNRLGLTENNGSTTVTGESILQSLGGWIGVLESMIPGTAFVTVYAIWRDILVSIVVASLFSLGFIARQVILRRSLTQAIAGAIGIAVAAYLPLRPGGHDADYFVLGFLTNLIYGVVLAVSVLARWPIVGVVVSLFKGSGFKWRSDSQSMARYNAATLILVALFAARLVVQYPLYLAGQIEALAVVKLAMGTPLYALTIWLAWLTIRSLFRKASDVA